MEINKNLLEYVKTHDKELTKYFQKNEQKITKYLNEINSTFSSALAMMGFYPKFYTIINHEGNVLWDYGYGTSWGSVKKFLNNVSKIAKDIEKNRVEEGSMKVRIFKANVLAIQHFINIYANPICVSVEFRGDCWEEMNDYHAIAIRYKDYFQYLAKNVNSAYEKRTTSIGIVQTCLSFEDVYTFYTDRKRLKYVYALVENIAENDSEDEDYDFEGKILDVTDKKNEDYTKLEIGDFYGKYVGYEYYHRYDDPWDI